jgi:ankyrin repeat protein
MGISGGLGHAGSGIPILRGVSTIFELIDAGDADGIRALLAADPAAAAAHDEQGLTVLMRASYRGGDVFAAVRGAEPPLEPFDRIVVGESEGLPAPDAWTPDGFTPLHIAAFVRNVDAARALLAAGADPNVLATASFARVTPLGTCAFAGANDVARVLLEHGADPELTADNRFTPLDSALANGNDELAQLLREHAAAS